MTVIAARPIPNSYWAIDHHILAGEYPGAKSDAEARTKIRALLSSGVRLFVDLTEEGESGLRPYQGIVEELAAELDMQARYLRLPIPDGSVPRKADEMAAILDALDDACVAGTIAYVHCWGGTGRTGTVVGCLYRRRGESGDDALAAVMRRWSTMEKAPQRPGGSPENEPQRRYVRDWVEPVGGQPSASDRIAGCLLAGAAGDALGAPVEFLALRAIHDRYGPAGIRDLDRAYGRVGAITDDTQMTLFTAEGLLRARTRREEGGEEDPRPVVWRAYLRWLLTQGDDVASHLHGDNGWLLGVESLHSRRAPGNTCLSALRSGVMPTRDRRINDSKGCGGVMRAAPAGLVDTDDAFALGCDVAALTHSHPAGFLSAGYVAELIHRILGGDELEAAAAGALARLERDPEHEETSRAVRRAMGLAREGEPSASRVERLGGGWVGEEALAMALYCALVHPADLEAALILAANHSGDTDSTAAIAGNIMGALLGRAAIPERWLAALELREEIEQLAADLAVGYDPSPEWRRRYPPE
jgi:ADP-ribosylglycohydrolase